MLVTVFKFILKVLIPSNPTHKICKSKFKLEPLLFPTTHTRNNNNNSLDFLLHHCKPTTHHKQQDLNKNKN